MKVAVTLKVLLGLLSAIAVPVVVSAGISQNHSSVETQRKEFASKNESPHHAPSNRYCNRRVSACPISE